MGEPQQAPKGPTMIKLDGKTVEFGSEAHIEHIEGAAAIKLDAATKATETLQAKLDAVEADKAKLQEKLDAASDEDVIASRVDARLSLERGAVKVLGQDAKLRHDGGEGGEAAGKSFSDREVMIAVVKHDASDFDAEGKSDDYLRARFDHIVEHTTDGPSTGAALSPGKVQHKDEGDKIDPAVKFRQDHAADWQSPLSMTKGDS